MFKPCSPTKRQTATRAIGTLRRYLATSLIVFSFAVVALAQTPSASPGVNEGLIAPDGISSEKLIEIAAARRADLLAARQRLIAAEGRLQQSGLRPNPTLDAEYGTPRVLGGDPEFDFSVGVTQKFELGGKRAKRKLVAQLELNQTRAEIAVYERALASEIRATYTGVLAAARQLDVLTRLIAADEELVRVTSARLREGDVAPLDLNLVKLEADRLKVQAIQARSELEVGVLQLRALIGADLSESLRLAPQPERPPRLDLSLNELTERALAARPDLQTARLAEQLGAARISLARANSVPDVAASARFSRSRGIADLPARRGGGFAIDTDNELTVGIVLDLPVFNRNQGEIAAAASERAQAARQREFLETAVRRDVAVAYRKYRAAAETLVIYATQIMPRAEDNLRVVRAAYGVGEFSVFEVVNEQRRLLENVTGYNQALRDYYAALNEIETALGAPLPPTAFAPVSQSVLPDRELSPEQSTRRATFSLPRIRAAVGAELAPPTNSKQNREDEK